jgi:hypothetical protein
LSFVFKKCFEAKVITTHEFTFRVALKINYFWPLPWFFDDRSIVDI